MKVLIIEDEKITRRSLTDILTAEGYEVHAAEEGEAGLDLFARERPAIVITDLRLPKLGGMEVLSAVLQQDPHCRVILITAFASVDTAIRSLKAGAYDYLTKPFAPEKLLSILRNIAQLTDAIIENAELKDRLARMEERPIIGVSEPMKRLLKTVAQVAQNDSTVLIEGESGTGKEMVARALHLSGPRRREKFVAVSVSSIPETLLESELFGHEKGAFTGAVRQHTGFFERANGGTLFIDDIDDVPMGVQVKLLRVIQERELTRVGGNGNIGIDVRIIGATKVDLRRMVDERRFREDLYYRLNIIPLRLPPLRERKEDIPLLVEHFFRKHRAEDKIMLLTAGIFAKLQSHHWPGNVRELENIVERMIALSFSGQIDPSVIDFAPYGNAGAADDLSQYASFDEYITAKETQMLRWALERCRGNVSDAARLLRIPRTTLSSKIARLLPGARTE
ncbi:MAG: sigma-54-dependent Fis family transcriptional regulator [Bacteroidetes bacterium]|nr:MAG: sigma-54-dependent Fis family transcriptional regulator [Bacteroidota bacterium]